MDGMENVADLKRKLDSEMSRLDVLRTRMHETRELLLKQEAEVAQQKDAVDELRYELSKAKRESTS